MERFLTLSVRSAMWSCAPMLSIISASCLLGPQSCSLSVRELRIALIWNVMSPGCWLLDAMAEWPAVIEQECRSVPICVPRSWCTDLRLPHWIYTVVFFWATETKLVSLSLSKVNSADSVATLHRSWIAVASWKLSLIHI